MKPIHILIFLLSFVILSCSEDNNSNDDNPHSDPIIGEWQLNRRIVWSSLEETYNPGDVTYKFNTDGTFNIISIIPEVDSETLEYEIITDCIRDPGCLFGGSPSEILIFNNNSRNHFSLLNEDTELFFGQGYNDGWNYYLERIP
ncbi:hypothetical protein [uncultured Winogradskyella sp.]|uniref:hypothetical protein n=1 Tax=uncultured Winogradskyella sp. TaxID=395353 RepID=UPI0026091CBE|nr:hypothetical protein [uncultured Winogradskyella sp.]